MRPLLGVNLSNDQWQPWPAGYVDAVAALGPEVVLFYAFDPKITASASHRDDLHRLLGLLPSCTVLLRIAGDFTATDALGRADDAIGRHAFYGVPRAELVTHNEWNLTSEAAPRPLADWVVWWERHLASLAGQVPHVVRHLAALSPTDDYLRVYEALAGSKVIQELTDVVDVHAYTETDLVATVEAVTRLFRGQGVSLTEFNRLLPSRVVTLAPTLDAALWFIAGGTVDWRGFDLLRLAQYRQDFVTTIEGDKPMPDQPTAPTFTVGEGVRALLTQHNDTARSDEHYVGDQFSITFGARGVYLYNKQSNETTFLPKA